MKKIIPSPSKPPQTGDIRIIGGQFRGKKLTFPAADGLRPTPNRVRETLFNWLMHATRSARCLDLFAGTGALGFEAYSRGASSVVFLETHPQTYQNLQRLSKSFQSPQLTVIQISALDYLNSPKIKTLAPFDIIFMDPPFAQPELMACIELLESSPLLIPGGLLYLESPQAYPLDPEQWHKMKLKKTGQVTYALYQKKVS